MDWKNRIKTINYRQGLDRFYFVLTLVWFFAWYLAFLFETLDSKVNLFTDNFVAMILAHIFIFAVPFVAYIILILVFKIFLWIINGFQEAGVTTPRARVKIFAGEGSFFNLVRKHRILILGIIIALILIGIFISFTFTVYNSYERKQEAQNMLKFDFGGLPPLPKLPSLKLPYIPVDER